MSCNCWENTISNSEILAKSQEGNIIVLSDGYKRINILGGSGSGKLKTAQFYGPYGGPFGMEKSGKEMVENFNKMATDLCSRGGPKIDQLPVTTDGAKRLIKAAKPGGPIDQLNSKLKSYEFCVNNLADGCPPIPYTGTEIDPKTGVAFGSTTKVTLGETHLDENLNVTPYGRFLYVTPERANLNVLDGWRNHGCGNDSFSPGAPGTHAPGEGLGDPELKEFEDEVNKNGGNSPGGAEKNFTFTNSSGGGIGITAGNVEDSVRIVQNCFHYNPIPTAISAPHYSVRYSTIGNNSVTKSVAVGANFPGPGYYSFSIDAIIPSSDGYRVTCGYVVFAYGCGIISGTSRGLSVNYWSDPNAGWGNYVSVSCEMGCDPGRGFTGGI